MEVQGNEGATIKKECDLCMEVSDVLIEKPHSMIIKGQLYISHRPKALFICMECLKIDIENM